MLLKRLYDAQGKCTSFLVKHSGLSAGQNFSHRMIEDCVADGLITIDGIELTMASQPEPLRYTIKRRPGYYCTSTGEAIPISPMAWNSVRRGELASREAKAWLVARGKSATDYEVTNAYECELAAEQHAKFRAVLAPSGNPVAAYTQEA